MILYKNCFKCEKGKTKELLDFSKEKSGPENGGFFTTHWRS
jgi:hypothetical protein